MGLSKARRAGLPHAVRDEQRVTKANKLGISVSQYLVLINRPCEVCGVKSEDADQTNGVYKRRSDGAPLGVIGRKCATALGFLDHDIERLRRAVTLLGRPPLN